MKRIALHFPRVWKAALYAVILTSWLTGSLWFYLHRWVLIEGEFGEEHSAWEPVLLKIHGASAMLMTIYFGYLLASHVPTGLRSRRNQLLGWLLLGSVALLIATSYGLYYIGGESFRSVVSWSHLSIGLCLPLVLGMHIAVGHRRPTR